MTEILRIVVWPIAAIAIGSDVRRGLAALAMALLHRERKP